MVGLKRLEWNPVITIGPGKTNDDSIKQFFDASQGNLVIMDMSEHHENITEAERLDLLGDWEDTRSVGKIQSHKDLENPDESKRQLKLVSYEPWVPDRSGNPEIPLWLAVDIARIEGRPVSARHQLGGCADDVLASSGGLAHAYIEAGRKMRLVQASLSKGRKRASELAEMDVDPNAQVARLHCADLFDLDYHHH
eukprot:jgi/Tetstr1/435307/TSEL_024226.t1